MAKQEHATGHQGAVTDPEHDRRLKENRDGGVHKDETKSSASHPLHEKEHDRAAHGHTTGAVRDPEHDGRLKENREKGVHKQA